MTAQEKIGNSSFEIEIEGSKNAHIVNVQEKKKKDKTEAKTGKTLHAALSKKV